MNATIAPPHSCTRCGAKPDTMRIGADPDWPGCVVATCGCGAVQVLEMEAER